MTMVVMKVKRMINNSETVPEPLVECVCMSNMVRCLSDSPRYYRKWPK